MREDKLPSADREPATWQGPVPSGPSAKQLANRVSNTSEEMAEYAWRFALAEVNHKAHESK